MFISMYVRTVRKSYGRFCQNQNFLDAQITRVCYHATPLRALLARETFAFNKHNFKVCRGQKKNEEIIEKRYLYDLARIVLYFAHVYHQTSVQSFFFKSTMKKSGA